MGADDGTKTGKGKPGSRARVRRTMTGGMAGRHGERLAPSRDGGAKNAAAKKKKDESAPAKRRASGFHHAGASAALPVRGVSQRRGFAEARVLTDWDTVLGEELAAACRPVRVSYAGKGFGATLVVLAEGARAPEVEMLAPRIVERVNAHYGYRAVSRVKVVQTATGMAEPSRGFDRAATPRGAPGQGPDDVSSALAAAELAAEVEDDGLRAALSRLGASVLRRRAAMARDAAAEDEDGRAPRGKERNDI